MATQFPDTAQTITLQAASDAIMTHNNKAVGSGGTALTDHDCRKMYGLPHTYTAGSIRWDDGEENLLEKAWDWMWGDTAHGVRDVKDHSSGEQLVINDSYSMLSGVLNYHHTDAFKSLRWDNIHAYSDEHFTTVAKSRGLQDRSNSAKQGHITSGYGAGDVSITGLRGFHSTGVNNFHIDRRPTTTAFRLRCNSIQQQVQDQGAITPLMGMEWGESGVVGSPEQLDAFTFNPGFRKEVINLQGVLIDNGPITAHNPRRQNLLTIARTQYLKIRNAAPISDDSKEGDSYRKGTSTNWGGIFAGPTNPRSYPCLTIFNQGYDTHTAGDAAGNGIGRKGMVEPDGAYRVYRGLIKNLTFTMEAGRPDYWQWQMQFEVTTNEKRSVSGLMDASQGQGQFTADSGNK